MLLSVKAAMPLPVMFAILAFQVLPSTQMESVNVCQDSSRIQLFVLPALPNALHVLTATYV